MASILVFCGSAKGQNPAFEKAGRALGKLIGNNGHALITGGGAVGLMGVVADSAMEHGAHVTGIIRSVFENVKILPLKYYNPQASGQDNLDSTIKALKFAVDAGVDIINYSGGGPEPATEELKVLKKAERKNTIHSCQCRTAC